MAKLLHWFGAVFLVLALLGIGTLLIFDTINQLQFTNIHRHAGAWSFMGIGFSYLCLLLGSPRPLKSMLKEIALGIAFFLWGCEQFLPPGPWATAVDTAVIVIFVTDLSLVIIERLKLKTSNRN
jgi:hypothetical protein